MFLLPRGNASGGPGTLCGSPHTLALTYVSHGYVMMVNDTRKALAETKRSGRRLAAEYAVTRILAESATIKDAVNGVLRVVGENLDWELGMFWEMEKQNQRLRFVDPWHAPDVEAAEFIKDSKDRTFTRGEGLSAVSGPPGNRCGFRTSVPILRSAARTWAARAGLHGALHFPSARASGYTASSTASRARGGADRDVLEMLADLDQSRPVRGPEAHGTGTAGN